MSTSSSRELILGEVTTVPTLPETVTRLVALSRSEDTSLQDIEQVIRPDPALTANLLRIANSAIFASGKEFSTLRQAVSRLGIDRVVSAALASALVAKLPPVLPGYGINAKDFFRHSLAVAVMSDRLGTELAVVDRDDRFTAGLLHDIGKLVVSSHLSKEAESITQELNTQSRTFVKIEYQQMGLDHAEVGGELARHWKLPTNLVDVARWHHEPSAVQNALVDTVHLANNLAHSLGYGADIGELSRAMEGAALDRLSISPRRLERVISLSIPVIADLEESFQGRR